MIAEGYVVRTCARCSIEFEIEGNTRVYLCVDCRYRNEKEPKPIRELTNREKQLVRGIVQGKLNKEIAFDLHLTEGTIKEYLVNIFKKTGCRNRTELAVKFSQETII